MKKNHTINCFIIISFVTAAWYKILFHAFLGEGYYYFFNGLADNHTIFRLDIGAGLLFDLIKPIFRDNFFFYQALTLVSFVIICVLFYFFVNEFTKRKDVSLIAGVLFGVNFATLFEMLGQGSYQNFVQRVFFLLLMLPSLIFFLKFKNNKKRFYYVLALTLCILSVFFAYFNMFFVVFFPAYLLGMLLLRQLKMKNFIPEFLLTLPFMLSFIIVYIPAFLGLPPATEKVSIFYYLYNYFDLIFFHTLRQLVFLSVPDQILGMIFGSFNNTHKDSIQNLFLPVVAINMFVGLFLYKKEKSLRLPLLTSIFFSLFVFVLNMYMRGDNVDHLGSGSRYLFAPSIGFSIFWAIVISYICRKRNIGLIYLLLVCWFAIQIVSINRELNGEQYKHTETKKIIQYVKKISPRLTDDSIVITPQIMGYWGSLFCNMFYGKKHTAFIPRLSPTMFWEDTHKRLFDPKKDRILGYDFEKEQVIDITKDYKKIIVDPRFN